MVDQNRCPECGTSLSPDAAPGQLCPRCLLSIVLEPDTDPGSVESPAPFQGIKSTEISAVESTQPDRIGPYRLTRKLGEGGMGEVYEAEQTEPVRRKVALKLIKWGMDTRRVVARFEAERQALAMMDHPSIARVYDAGATDQGRPYFAMELVKGVPITDYCDRQKLPTQDRLELFTQVCEGVQHAHQKGIIHRDIKPSNVLVTIQDDKPVPKIIDFGVAKATEQRLTEKTVFTELGQLVGTPEYMSPEQAEMTGLDIDTRTDVYSLGVLLYELLSGALPFESRELRKAGYDEIRRRIREDEPAKPSTRISSLGEQATTPASNRATAPAALVRRLRGDLDWISMKALEKDRTRRYGSPQELAADVARHINNEPVVAGPPSAAYRIKKFVRRHRFGVAAASVVALALVLGVIGTTVGMARAVAAEDQARDEARRSEASKLVALGERELERYPTAALAYAIKSLEVADTEAGRFLALRVLQQGPVARIARVWTGGETSVALNLDFSPNGEWVATGGFKKSLVLNRDGERRFFLGEYSTAGQGGFGVRFTPGGDALVANRRGDVRMWSIPEGRELRHGQVDQGPSNLVMGDDEFATVSAVDGQTVIRSWPLGEGEPRLLGRMDPLGREDWDAEGGLLAFGRGTRLYLQFIDELDAPPRLLTEEHLAVSGEFSTDISVNIRSMALSSNGDLVAAKEPSGAIRIWPTDSRLDTPPRVLEGDEQLRGLWFRHQSRWLAETGTKEGLPTIRLWDLEAPSGAAPITLRRADSPFVTEVTFDSEGHWLASTNGDDVAFWWLNGDYPRVFHTQGTGAAVVFTPDGRSLISASNDGTVRVWPLAAGGTEEPRILYEGELTSNPGIAIDPRGRNVAVAGAGGRVLVIPLDGSPVTTLEGFSDRVEMYTVAFSEDGRLVAAGPFLGPADEKAVRVFDLETGATQVLGPVPGTVEGYGGVWSVYFKGNDQVLASVAGVGLVSFDLATGEHSVLLQGGVVALNHARTVGVGGIAGNDMFTPGPARFRLDGSAPEPLHSYGLFFGSAAFDPTDRLLATGSYWSGEGIVRVGPESGGEPHLLLGHTGTISDLEFSPDSRWLASTNIGGTIRVWRVPDVSKPPPHKLPLARLLAKLRTHTNLRAVPDPAFHTGYKLELGPFPGWADPPEW